MLMTGSIWLGVATACREVVKERGLVEREFDVGVRLDAYILAKAFVLFTLTFVQVAMLTVVVMRCSRSTSVLGLDPAVRPGGADGLGQRRRWDWRCRASPQRRPGCRPRAAAVDAATAVRRAR